MAAWSPVTTQPKKASRGCNLGAFAYGATAGRSAADKGKYNEEYIAGLYEATDENGERLYSDKEIQVALDLHRKAVDDPDFDIWDSWVEYANDLEAQEVIGGIIGTRGLRTTRSSQNSCGRSTLPTSVIPDRLCSERRETNTRPRAEARLART